MKVREPRPGLEHVCPVVAHAVDPSPIGGHHAEVPGDQILAIFGNIHAAAKPSVGAYGPVNRATFMKTMVDLKTPSLSR